jgi:nitronate monooxygenase
MLIGLSDAASFARELDEARSILSIPHEAPLQLGAGYLGWMLDKGGNPVDTLHVALERRVSSIWLSFGDDLGKWVERIRQYDQSRKHTHRTLIWILVNSVAEAEVAINQWKADVLVVQGETHPPFNFLVSQGRITKTGIEAGGHGHSQALPLVTLLSLIKESLPDSPPLVAAGGLANGAQVAAMLVLGASGAAVGTRFLATPESTYTINQKNAVLAATHSVRTPVFDQVRGTVGWPLGIDGRAIPNQTLEDEASGVEPEELKKRFVEGVKKDDTSRSVVWSGASVGLVHGISGAEVCVRQIALEHLV